MRGQYGDCIRNGLSYLLVVGSVLIGGVQNLSASPMLSESIPTQSIGLSENGMMSLNPAATANQLSRLEVSRWQSDSKLSLRTGSQGDGEIREHERTDQHNFVTGKFAMGDGVGIGLQGQFSGRQLKAKTQGSRQVQEENFVLRGGSAIFDLDVAPQIRIGFMYRYFEIRNDVRGNWNINTQDKTEYRDTYGGYGLGMSFDNGQVFAGGYYHPSIRGKALIEGESKLLSISGKTGFDLGLKISPQFELVAGLRRYTYRASDALTPSTSPVNQREISIRGIDPDQFAYPMELRNFGVGIRISEMLGLRASILQYRKAFDGREGIIPANDEKSNQSLLSQSMVIGLRANRGTGYGELSYSRSLESIDKLTDAGSWFGARDYREYESTANTVALILGATR
jgi:hypothetical protein